MHTLIYFEHGTPVPCRTSVELDYIVVFLVWSSSRFPHRNYLFLLEPILWNWMITCSSILLLFGFPIQVQKKYRTGVSGTQFHSVFQSSACCIVSLTTSVRKPKIELKFLLLVLIYQWISFLMLMFIIVFWYHWPEKSLFRHDEKKTWDKFEPNFFPSQVREFPLFHFYIKQLSPNEYT